MSHVDRITAIFQETLKNYEEKIANYENEIREEQFKNNRLGRSFMIASKMHIDTVAELREITKKKESLEEKIKELERKNNEISGDSIFHYVCLLSNPKKLSVEIKYNGIPVHVNEQKKVFNMTKLSFTSDVRAGSNSFTYHIGGESVGISEIRHFYLKKVITEKRDYQIEILSKNYLGLIKIEIDGKIIDSKTNSITIKNIGLSNVFRTAIQFSYRPGLKKEDVKIYSINLGCCDYTLLSKSPSLIIGDMTCA